jgi:hypothetical protein
MALGHSLGSSIRAVRQKDGSDMGLCIYWKVCIYWKAELGLCIYVALGMAIITYYGFKDRGNKP